MDDLNKSICNTNNGNSDSDSSESWTFIENKEMSSTTKGKNSERVRKDPDEDTDGVAVITDDEEVSSTINITTAQEPPPIYQSTPYVSSPPPEYTPSKKTVDIETSSSTTGHNDSEEELPSDFFMPNRKIKSYVHKRNNHVSNLLNFILVGALIIATTLAVGFTWGINDTCSLDVLESVNGILANLQKLQKENEMLKAKIRILRTMKYQHKTVEKDVNFDKYIEQQMHSEQGKVAPNSGKIEEVLEFNESPMTGYQIDVSNIPSVIINEGTISMTRHKKNKETQVNDSNVIINEVDKNEVFERFAKSLKEEWQTFLKEEKDFFKKRNERLKMISEQQNNDNLKNTHKNTEKNDTKENVVKDEVKIIKESEIKPKETHGVKESDPKQKEIDSVKENEPKLRSKRETSKLILDKPFPTNPSDIKSFCDNASSSQDKRKCSLLHKYNNAEIKKEKYKMKMEENKKKYKESNEKNMKMKSSEKIKNDNDDTLKMNKKFKRNNDKYFKQRPKEMKKNKKAAHNEGDDEFDNEVYKENQHHNHFNENINHDDWYQKMYDGRKEMRDKGFDQYNILDMKNKAKWYFKRMNDREKNRWNDGDKMFYRRQMRKEYFKTKF